MSAQISERSSGRFTRAQLRAVAARLAEPERAQQRKSTCRALAIVALALSILGLVFVGWPSSQIFLGFGESRLREDASSGYLQVGSARPVGVRAPHSSGEFFEMRTKNVGVLAFVGSAAVFGAAAICDDAAAQAAVQWRVADGGNGHWYKLSLETVGSWDDARINASNAGGHLATLNSQPEAEFVRQIGWLQNIYGGYVGLQKLPSTGWHWITGEPLVDLGPYSLVESGDGTCSNFADLQQGSTTPPVVNDIGCNWWQGPYFVEWSADCNADGIVDYGQILSGQLADLNANGVPDVCEWTVTVPGDYATIQAAIDATPSGSHRVVAVAPGIYAGPITFGGRDVIVRGAGAGKTAIAGTGVAATSVVRFTGGEPSTAALEGVTVRGGLTGWPLPNLPSALIGGGVTSFGSAANLRDCVIEDNAAGFGGGAYFRFSTGDIERCIFKNNSASADGGGLQVYGGSVAIVDSTFENNYSNSRGGGMHLVEGTTSLANTVVRTNDSNNLVGGVSWVPQATAGSYLTLTNCEITGNAAVKAQGGIGAVESAAITMSLTGTSVCANLPLPNISGQWLNLGGNNICVCGGDIVLDGEVNGVDLASLLTQWGTPGQANFNADTNHDGLVDGLDLTVVLTSWGPCAP